MGTSNGDGSIGEWGRLARCDKRRDGPGVGSRGWSGLRSIVRSVTVSRQCAGCGIRSRACSSCWRPPGSEGSTPYLRPERASITLVSRHGQAAEATIASSTDASYVTNGNVSLRLGATDLLYLTLQGRPAVPAYPYLWGALASKRWANGAGFITAKRDAQGRLSITERVGDAVLSAACIAISNVLGGSTTALW